MKEILLYTSGLSDIKAGVETYILNLNDAIDRNNYRFVLLVRNAQKDKGTYKLMINSGIEVVDLDCHSLNVKSVFSFYRKLNTYFRNNCGRFSFLHFHGCDDPFVIGLAKKYGIPSCAVHAHSVTRENINPVLKRIKNLTSLQNIKKADYLFASCESAGKARFGSRQFIILNSTVDVEKFAFSSEKRESFRRGKKLNDEIVFFFSGRMSEIKNIPFLIKVFESTVNMGLNAKLFLAGDGEKFQFISDIVNKSDYGNRIEMLGNCSDIDRILSGSDVYIQTSFSEGFSMSVLEAQCSGIPMFLSTGFPKEVDVTDLVHKVELDDGPDKWAETIIGMIKNNIAYDRKDYARIIKEKGYDMGSSANRMCRIYSGNYNVNG